MLSALGDLMRGRSTVVLTGAGVSTESGIPDYRGPGTLARARKPIQFKQFVASDGGRRRYWARSMIGFPRVAAAEPNAGHAALAALEAGGHVCGLITQNVDGLHSAAGHRRVIELHGTLAEVRCLDCGAIASRRALQERLEDDNPAFVRRSGESAPDGDVDLVDSGLEDFVVPVCAPCGGVLKPNVVFFGENVPRVVVDAAWDFFDRAEVLLVAGSSLTVFSGFRFVRRAVERGMPVALINRGPTRADELVSVRLDGGCGELLSRLAAALPGPRGSVTG